MPDKVIYYGVFFDRADVSETADALRDGQGAFPLAKEIAMPHITFGFRRAVPFSFVTGADVRVRCIGYGNDGRNEAILVSLDDDCSFENAYRGVDAMHVTVSVSEGTAPSNSAYIPFAAVDGTHVLRGKTGWFDGVRVRYDDVPESQREA